MRLNAHSITAFFKALGLASALLCLTASPIFDYLGTGQAYAQTSQKKTTQKKTTQTKSRTASSKSRTQKTTSAKRTTTTQKKQTTAKRTNTKSSSAEVSEKRRNELQSQQKSLQEQLGSLKKQLSQAEASQSEASDALAASEAAIKEVEVRMRELFKAGKPNSTPPKGAAEIIGALLSDNGFYQFCDTSEISGVNFRKGIKSIFEGAFMAYRNPSMHANLTCSQREAFERIVQASQMMSILTDGEVRT